VTGRAGLDYEAEYNNRRRVADFGAIAARWQLASDAYRKAADAQLDQPYGAGERHRYDLFHAAERAAAPTVVYIHGGYWQWGDRSAYAFVARALNADGLNVALPSYSLCPTGSVLDIVGELRQALSAIGRKTGTPLLVVGHSAGGHLTAAMVATDWGTVDGAPADLVHAGIAISGVFDLRPLLTTSINDAVGLDPRTAVAASPRLWPPPPPGRTFTAAVGAGESSEFLRQSRDIVEHWSREGVQADYLEIPGTNHFTVLDHLASPETSLYARVVALAREA